MKCIIISYEFQTLDNVPHVKGYYVFHLEQLDKPIHTEATISIVMLGRDNRLNSFLEAFKNGSVVNVSFDFA